MVKVYTRANCQRCRLTKMALNRKNILFKEFDIDDNPEKLKFFKTLGFTSSPVVETDTDTWCGFQPDKINNI